jgi:4'-phosphopantetheinyl transferase
LPSADLSLGRADVHVWRLSLEQNPDQTAASREVLSADELERADRFLRSEHGARFVASRGGLRILLGRYLNAKPSELTFRYSERGKPSLEHPRGTDIQFNLSHSAGLAIYAFSRGRALGVDIEGGDRRVAPEQIARRFFSPREAADLESLAPAARKQAFLRCWTRKEAYLKAVGSGLSAGLGGFSVSLKSGEPARLLQVDGQPGEAERWRMRDLAPGDGYAAALCVEGSDWQVWGGRLPTGALR